MPFGKVFRVLQKTGNPHSVLLESKELEEGLLLESGTVVSLSQAEKDEIRKGYAKVTDAYGCLGAIKFPDNNTGTKFSFYITLVTACMPVGKVLDSEIFRITGVSFYSLGNGSLDGDGRCSDLKKLLSSGKFYLSWSPNVKSKRDCLDLTVCMQNQGQKDEQERFFWNRLMHVHFKHFGIACELWLFRIMSGGIDIKTVYVGAQQAKAMVISRLSCERAGTRFNVRGANDEGNVANFVESEQVIVLGNNISSFMQVRGSIPLFWEQPGLNVGSHKVRMGRGFEATAPTYERHFMSLVETYGECAIVNLLGSKEGENVLSKTFQAHHEESKFKDSIPFYCFDYHAQCRGKMENLSRLKSKIWSQIEKFGSYVKLEDQSLRLTQTGVLRINCLDCLDRTNSTKTYFGLEMLPKQLESLGLGGNMQLEDRFKEAFKAAWPVTGDLISRMYAGTGALEGKTKLKDGARSVSRAIQNNFLDQNKQNAIDLLIHGTNSLDIELAARASNLLSGDCLQAPAVVLRAMCNKSNAYSADKTVRVAIGTWNVNGGKHLRYKNQTLADWLLNFSDDKTATNEQYRAVFDFVGNEEGDLSFASGDIIYVHEMLPDGEWMRGDCNGMPGIFPASYVSKVYPAYKALFDFPAQEEQDLSFVSGDIIEVTEMSGEWWKGKVRQDNYDPDQFVGIFPANFVERYDKDLFVDWNKPMDIYAIGFQEMVELSAGNIVNTSMTNHAVWAAELEKTLSATYKYIPLASEQLVGVCLYIFIRPEHAPHIRDLEIVTVKTGMGGATGNKGGIGIRMQFYNSSVCFVCSHLAAGQGQIYDRNSDFAEICKKMVFSGNKDIYCHDYVFWCGDLNYRIDMPNEEVKNLVAQQDWATLQEHDQLYIEKKERRVFQLFKEGETKFAPTYKYDLFSDEYDTSEKCRTPAWTDRVLWFRRKWFAEKQGDDDLVSVNQEHKSGSLLYYNRAEIKTSDHRPVIAVLDIDVVQCTEDRIDETFDEVVDAQGPPDASVFVSVSETGSLMDDALQGSVLAYLENVGEIILSRPLNNKLLVIFKEGASALKALALDGTSVGNMPVFISLKSEGWKEDFEHELRHRSHSASFHDSNDHGTDTHYDYPPDAFDEDYDENQNYTGLEEQYYEESYDKEQIQDYYESKDYYTQYEVTETPENLHEDINDPGWACEGTAYSTAASLNNQDNVDITVPTKSRKASVPPRPPSGPAKKQAPPRPNTLPTLPTGPPIKSSQVPIIPPSPADSNLHSTPTILIPEPAPLPTKPPKITPRTSVPKRRAPAPPPGKAPVLPQPSPQSLKPKRAPPRKAPVLSKPRSQSLKPKRAPPLPVTAPKGLPSKHQSNKAAAIQSNHSAPSLLEFDPLNDPTDFAGLKLQPPLLLPSNSPNFPAANSCKSSINVPSAKPNRESYSDLFGPSFFAQSRASNPTLSSMKNATSLKPTSITPPPISTSKAGDSWMSQRSNSLQPVSVTPPPIVPRQSSDTAVRQPASFMSSNLAASDWLNSALSQVTPSTSMQNPNTTRTIPPNYKPMISTNPLESPMVPMKPKQSSMTQPHQATVFPNGTFTIQESDPFGMPPLNDPFTVTSVPKNDPWGSANPSSTVPNSFSTDFSSLNLN